MNPFKIIGWVAIAIAIVSAFTEIPYGGAILILLGLVVGFAMATEDHVRVLVSAVVLFLLSQQLLAIPKLGSYLASIFGAVGTFAAGAALMIITRNIWRRYKP